ncbi:uracil-DNA glycosylase [Wolbachia endosymbiont of Howardula sp.]|uniref:uracil-DNA glycosylase n=1 Tax=Wolbachia endosymbiont of Howardula sp. TaxID=2916816 RepID=UPI00217EB6E7|nr:uracil-DNA glycosylase [Wolbachia endosymbiont of Howardula sp.]UWI82992.1 uracil-DNA glycosylase [Wolbachia endosymbiont of Howardula sp.]
MNTTCSHTERIQNHQAMFPSDWIYQARRLANVCNSLDDLKRSISSFEGCHIKTTATNTVFSDGNPHAKIMLIGEAPGINEDIQGIPFCGASGVLLDKMLHAINLDRSQVYISNTIFWRPPGNRKPTNLELDICKPFVEKHIAIVAPNILILVGGIACYNLLNITKTISVLRGRFYQYNNQYLSHAITTSVIFHPAYLLRQPTQKRVTWEDLKKIKEYIDTWKNMN